MTIVQRVLCLLGLLPLLAAWSGCGALGAAIGAAIDAGLTSVVKYDQSELPSLDLAEARKTVLNVFSSGHLRTATGTQKFQGVRTYENGSMIFLWSDNPDDKFKESRAVIIQGPCKSKPKLKYYNNALMSQNPGWFIVQLDLKQFCAGRLTGHHLDLDTHLGADEEAALCPSGAGTVMTGEYLEAGHTRVDPDVIFMIKCEEDEDRDICIERKKGYVREDALRFIAAINLIVGECG